MFSYVFAAAMTVAAAGGAVPLAQGPDIAPIVRIQSGPSGSEPPHKGKGCPKFGIRSPASKTPAVLHIANSTGRTIQLYWIGFDGNWNYYKELKTGQDYKQPTYVGHKWVAVDMRDNCVDGVATAGPGTNIMEFFGD